MQYIKKNYFLDQESSSNIIQKCNFFQFTEHLNKIGIKSFETSRCFEILKQKDELNFGLLKRYEEILKNRINISNDKEKRNKNLINLKAEFNHKGKILNKNMYDLVDLINRNMDNRWGGSITKYSKAAIRELNEGIDKSNKNFANHNFDIPFTNNFIILYNKEFSTKNYFKKICQRNVKYEIIIKNFTRKGRHKGNGKSKTINIDGIFPVESLKTNENLMIN